MTVSLALFRRLQANNVRRIGGGFGRIAIAPTAVIAERLFRGALLLAELGKLFGRGEAFVGIAVGEKLVCHLGMPLRAGELVHRVAVPIEAEPAHAVEDRLDGRVGRSGTIGILDAEQELAAMMPGEEPVEERRACAADMQETRRGRREPCHHRPGFVACHHARLLPKMPSGDGGQAAPSIAFATQQRGQGRQ